MTIGTRSVLYGAHCAVLHPWFLAVAWSKLYGFPWDVRLWASFWLHDIGYISKPNMDGSEEETHVELGAKIMGLLFGESWAAFTAAHSRYWAKRNGRQFSRLCVADKLAFVLTPAWLYLPMTKATGELSEYMLRAKERQAGSEHFTDFESARLNSADAREWLEGLKSYTRRWIEEHRNGGADNWTVGACGILGRLPLTRDGPGARQIQETRIPLATEPFREGTLHVKLYTATGSKVRGSW